MKAVKLQEKEDMNQKEGASQSRSSQKGMKRYFVWMGCCLCMGVRAKKGEMRLQRRKPLWYRQERGGKQRLQDRLVVTGWKSL